MSLVGAGCSSGVSGDKEISLKNPCLSSHSHFPIVHCLQQSQSHTPRSSSVPRLLRLLRSILILKFFVAPACLLVRALVAILLSLHICPATDSPQKSCQAFFWLPHPSGCDRTNTRDECLLFTERSALMIVRASWGKTESSVSKSLCLISRSAA